jgi:hypothetical protein
MQVQTADDVVTKPRQARRGLGQIVRLTKAYGGDRELARRVKAHIKAFRIALGDRHKLVPDRIQRAAELKVAAEDARREFLAGSLDARISLGRIEAIALQAEAELLRHGVPDTVTAGANASPFGQLLDELTARVVAGAAPETAADKTHASDSPGGSEGHSDAAGPIQPAVAGEPAAAADSDTAVSAGSPVSGGEHG